MDILSSHYQEYHQHIYNTKDVHRMERQYEGLHQGSLCSYSSIQNTCYLQKTSLFYYRCCELLTCFSTQTDKPLLLLLLEGLHFYWFYMKSGILILQRFLLFVYFLGIFIVNTHFTNSFNYFLCHLL